MKRQKYQHSVVIEGKGGRKDKHNTFWISQVRMSDKMIISGRETLIPKNQRQDSSATNHEVIYV